MESKPSNRSIVASSPSSARVIRAAVVGAGYISEFHARAIRALPNVELIGVCDANLGRARSFANEWGGPKAFDSLQSMLADQQIDAVHVARDGPWGLAKSRGNVRERIRAGEHKIGRGADVTNRGYVSATEGSSEPPDTRSG